jgi:hypothetical protein
MIFQIASAPWGPSDVQAFDWIAKGAPHIHVRHEGG